MQIPVIVIFAPTASGKTALAVNLFGRNSHYFFKDIRFELISADSVQVYRGLDIGSAKPSLEEKNKLTHHLIDLYEPDQQFNVSDFVKLCDEKCVSLYNNGIIPVVLGGTGFYIRNFILGLPATPESDEKIRKEIQVRLKTEGKEKLYDELMRIDPVSAEKINVNDAYRICRALEIFYSTGKPKSSFEMNTEPRKEYRFCTIVLNREREDLYERINRRVDLMYQNGLKEEVLSLMQKGCTKETPAMQAIGYREWFGHDLNSEGDIERILYEIKRNSRKYAKKQYVFMNDIPGATKICMNDENECQEKVRKIVEDFLKENLS